MDYSGVYIVGDVMVDTFEFKNAITEECSQFFSRLEVTLVDTLINPSFNVREDRQSGSL